MKKKHKKIEDKFEVYLITKEIPSKSSRKSSKIFGEQILNLLRPSNSALLDVERYSSHSKAKNKKDKLKYTIDASIYRIIIEKMEK